MSQHRRSRDTVSSPHHTSWGVPSILLAIVTMASPILIGGVHALTAAAIALAALVGLWWSLANANDTTGQTPPFALSIPAIAFAVMALFCLIQLIPVPTALYRIIQPEGYAALMSNWETAFDGSPASTWHLLTLDPRQTTAHGMRWIALAATAALATRVIRRRRDRRRWFGILLLTGAVVAAVGAAQYFSGTKLILGLYEAQIDARSISPFVNTNHAAAYYALIALIGIAYGLDHLRRSPVRASLGALAATAGVLLCAAHGSDGANIALAIGVVALGVAALTREAPKNRARRRRFHIVALAVLLFVVVAAFFIPTEWTVAEDEEGLLASTSAEMRIHMSHSALDAAGDFALVGSGAGSVERVLPPYIDWGYAGPSTIPTIENEPIEWAMTLGPVAALLALLFFLATVARTAPHLVRRKGRRGPATAFVLILFLGIISLFHFPFSTLGISLVAVVAIEACLHGGAEGLRRSASRKTGLLFALALTVALAGLFTARTTVLSPGAEQDLEVDDRERVQRALHLYPTDGVLLSAMSLNARAQGDRDQALALARRAFAQRPHPQQQYLLAGSLANASEYEEAAHLYGSLFDRERQGSVSLFGWYSSRLRYDLPEPRLRAIALADGEPRIWRRFSRILEEEEGHLAAIDFALALVEERPQRPEAHLTLIENYRRAEQVELAEMYARMLISQDLTGTDGARPAGLLLLLELLSGEGRMAEARSIAHRAFLSGQRSPDLGRAVLERLLPDDPAQLEERHRPLFDVALEVGCVPPYEKQHRRVCWRAEAFFSEAAGDVERAATYLRRIRRFDDDPRPLGMLLARHGRCGDLASLTREFRGLRHHGALERQAAVCADASD